MCLSGDGDNKDPYADLKITDVQRSDPATEARQKMLWDQAQQFASSSPYTSQYGGPSAMPGMSQMSQRGQQYLTNSILGPGSYQNDAQNLGF